MDMDKTAPIRYCAPMPDSHYPIGAVAVLTGLTVDTLRAWERRHKVVTPSRDDRGRVYGDADVRRLQLVAAAVSRGHAVGRLARLDDAALAALLTTSSPVPGTALSADPTAAPRRVRRAVTPADDGPTLSVPLGRVLAAVRRFDASEVEREIGRVAATLPPRDLIHAWVLPLMRHTGTEWHAGRLSTAQEHLLSAALRSLFGGIIRAMPHAPRRPNLLLTTLPRDRHEFGILGAAMLAALAGVRVTYLGVDLPVDEIVDAARRSGASVVVLGLTYTEARTRAAEDIERVTRRLGPGIELWLGGALAVDLHRAAPQATVFRDLTAFESALARIGGRL
jgi:MerR family transcriptional regulator, light-induced transcriptional regulator